MTEVQLKEGNFHGPQISKLLKDTAFDTKLNEPESPVWASLKLLLQVSLATENTQTI
jgi:hypothetical protein